MFILDKKTVAAALPMSDCIAAMREALSDLAQGNTEQFPRFQLKPHAPAALMGLMPVFRAGGESVWCLKDILVCPDNPARGLESHQGAILVHDGATGRLLAIVDATEITAIRTAATSAVATQLLAPPDAGRVAIIGTGRQARTHIEALRLILPAARFVIWGRSPDRVGCIAHEMDAEAADDARTAVRDADIVCTLTSSRTPVIERRWLKPGCHINAVGASRPDARELGADIIAAAELFVDSRTQAAQECGEYLLPLADGLIEPDHIRADIGELLTGTLPGRSASDALTVFKSLGMAVEDMAAALCAIKTAAAAGLATDLPW